jgi:hypothetical protein
MTQLQMFDPRLHPPRTAEMLGDVELCRAIDRMRPRRRRNAKWPYVERLLDIEGRPAWAVDDCGLRYVVVNGTVWRLEDIASAEGRLRSAALAAFARLDEIGQQGSTTRTNTRKSSTR